jgi:NADH:ubiquinone reductase (H+-translocating)
VRADEECVPMSPTSQRPHVLIVGGGHVGMYVALRLEQRLRSGEAEVTLIDPLSYMTYQPFLPEAAAGNLEPRHVVVPLRQLYRRVRLLNGHVLRVDHARRVVEFEPGAGEPRELSYDILIMAPGSVSRTLPIPGLAQWGIGFKSVGEAIYLRNHVLSQLDVAASATDEALRRKALTFVFVGGGYAGVEALAELEDMARYASRYYDTIAPSDMRWMLVESTDRVLPEVGEDLGRYTVEQLRQRGIEVRLGTLLKSAENRHIELSDGEEFDAETLVWTAGVRPNPLTQATDLPTDDKGRIKTTEFLSVEGLSDAWAAGDSAAVPDLTAGPEELCGPSAQHAVRQASRLADNVVASLRGRPAKAYIHAHVGSVASLGLYQGAAQVYGIRVRGWPAWFMHRTYHMKRMPTLNRKVRVLADWTLALFFRREIVSLSALQNPRGEFELATRPPPEDGRLKAEPERTMMEP